MEGTQSGSEMHVDTRRSGLSGDVARDNRESRAEWRGIEKDVAILAACA